MRTILALFLMCGTANAACNDKLIEFISWSAKPVSDITTETTTVFISHANKPIKMIDAMAGYKDALGGSIGSFELKRDASIEPKGKYTETRQWTGSSFDRLLNLKPEDVTMFTCVNAVLYDDGSKETFR